MLQIIPSILTNNPQELKDLINQAEEVDGRVQIDIIDGQYVNNKTIDPGVLVNVDTNLKLDFHLMVKEPVNWVEKCASVGADRIIGHIEMMQNQVEFVGKVQEVGFSVGLAIDLKTPVSALDQTILNDLDVVLVMSVPAGFGGQRFAPSALLKVKELDEIRVRDDTPFRICVDGGVTIKNIEGIRKMGADEVSIGRIIFKGDLTGNIEKYRRAACGGKVKRREAKRG